MRAENDIRKNIEKITWFGLVANVALAMIKLVIGVAGDSLAELTDAGMSQQDKKKIQTLIQSIVHVQGTHRIRSRKTGNKTGVISVYYL